MNKHIFSEEEISPTAPLQPKQEFDEQGVQIETECETIEAEIELEESLKPSRFWVRALLVAFLLLGVAVLAQSVQWIIDTFQNRQWIYLAFSLVFALFSFTGVGILVREWRRLVYLRKHQQNQQMSQQLLLEELPSASGEMAVKFCNEVIARLNHRPLLAQSAQRWQRQLDDAYNAKEVLYLFSENVLSPIDRQVKQLISKSAIENAIIVAVSPLAVVDILMVAWRNFSLINKISHFYGMELGYFSRLKLFKMVLTNMAFAGATEIASDLGTEFFSQNLTAKLSMRAGQGIGVGLLTARLGIKAMEFCRPLAFQADERPKLSMVRQALLGAMKETFFEKHTEKMREKV